jgi:hypothetical protein
MTAMRKLSRFGALVGATVMAATSAAALTFGSPTAMADDSSNGAVKTVPLTSTPRRCDFTSYQFVPSDTMGTGWADISSNGSTVTADIHMNGVRPDIWYGLRVVQMPRPGISCAAGEPGVGAGRLYTDSAGNGSTLLQMPIMSGATGVWVSVEGPLGAAQQLSGDFRTSDYVTSI